MKVLRSKLYELRQKEWKRRSRKRSARRKTSRGGNQNPLLRIPTLHPGKGPPYRREMVSIEHVWKAISTIIIYTYLKSIRRNE
jgi:hypothetical protein